MVADILNAFVVLSNFVILPAIAYGAQLAIGALGVTLIFGILRFANFAHGDMMAFGTMLTILVTWWLMAMGITLGPLPTALLALPVGILGTIAVALLIDRFVFRFYRLKRSPPIIFLIASVGVMFVLNAVVRIVIGPNQQRFADGERFLFTVRDFSEFTGLEEGLGLRLPVAITVVVAIVVVAALFWFLQYTRTGKAMRAYSDNEDLALLSGVSPDRVVAVTWIIAATLATIAGVLYGLDKGFLPYTYFQLLLPIFAAVIVGGIGQPLGAIVGGFVVAFSEVALTYPYKRVLGYLGIETDGLAQLLATEYKFAVSFFILVLVLLVRPTGIFRGRVL